MDLLRRIMRSCGRQLVRLATTHSRLGTILNVTSPRSYRNRVPDMLHESFQPGDETVEEALAHLASLPDMMFLAD